MNPYDLMTITRPDYQVPHLHRGSMVARPWHGFWKGLLALWKGAPPPPASFHSTPQAWEKVASVRRSRFVLAITLATLTAAWLQWPRDLHGYAGVLGFVQWFLFTILFAWVSAGFLTAVMGYRALRRRDPYALPLVSAALDPIDESARTALIMPICHEHVDTVFAGLRATCESLAATRNASLFDVFILSDSRDPHILAQEMAAWADLRARLGHSLRLFYRVRQRHGRKKAGNVADFCRRWGKDYRYMIVLDADSIMSGSALTQLVSLMEANPSAGIIQTAPRSVGQDSLHARSQQFAGRVSGRLFTAGMQYWQLGESHYWGHNAILRIAPFMAHCGLALLPGNGSLSGEILSHDFVEAALLRRAGYHTWIVPDLEGSYEQQPAHLLEELQRDRRWCQGNLKNFRLLWEPGFHAVHRAMLVTGVMAYASAPLWLAYILTSLTLSLVNPEGATFPVLWPVTLGMLMIPRFLAVAAVIQSSEAARFGGIGSLIASATTEALLSMAQAPLRMMAHSVFVISAMTGFKLEWKSPARESEALSWSQAWNHYRSLSVLGGLLLVVGAWAGASPLLWMTPVILPWLLAAPLAVLTSRSIPTLGLPAALDIPEERRPPSVLRNAWQYAGRSRLFSLPRRHSQRLPRTLQTLEF